MITRINFLEKKRLQITYAIISVAIASAFLICLLLYGVLWFNTLRAKNRITFIQTDIERLKKEREDIIHQKIGPQGEGGIAEIQTTLEKALPWSSIISSVTGSLPSRVWLASLKSANKEESPTKKEIIINGQAKNPQSLAGFLANLGGNPDFEKVVLTTSSEETSGVFNFTISCDIGNKKWILKP